MLQQNHITITRANSEGSMQRLCLRAWISHSYRVGQLTKKTISEWITLSICYLYWTSHEVVVVSVPDYVWELVYYC